MPATYVVLGAGPVGRAVVTALRARGVEAAVVTRSATTVAGAISRRADLTDLTAATAALAGAEVVFQCTTPPYYRWPEQFPELQAHIVAAAASAGALLVVAENLYGYGRVAGPLTEDLPLAASTSPVKARSGRGSGVIWQPAIRPGGCPWSPPVPPTSSGPASDPAPWSDPGSSAH